MKREDAIRTGALRLMTSRANRRDVLKRAGLATAGAAALGAGFHRSASAQDGNTPQGPQVDRLLFWTRASPDDPGQPNLYTQIEARATAYTEATGTPIEIVTVPNDDFRPRMSVAAPGGQGPDVFGPVAHDWVGEFAIQQIALELSEDQIEGIDDFQQVGLDLVRVDGPLYGIPLQLESVALIYNRELVPEPPTTWEELVQIATDVTEGETYGFGFPLLEQYHEGPFFMGFGSYIFRYEEGAFDTEDIGLNNEGGVEAARFLRDMYWEQQPPMPEAVIDRASMHGFIEGMMESGQLAMTINGPWRENPLQSAGIDYGVAVLPTLPNGEPMRPFVGVQALLVNNYSQNQEAAIDFANFMAGSDSAAAIFEADRKVPARNSALESEPIASDPNVSTWAEQASFGEPMPNIAAMSQVWTPWGGAMDAIIPANLGDDDIQDILDGAVAQIRNNIEEFMA